jgi:hypothetical protein
VIRPAAAVTCGGQDARREARLEEEGVRGLVGWGRVSMRGGWACVGERDEDDRAVVSIRVDPWVCARGAIDTHYRVVGAVRDCDWERVLWVACFSLVRAELLPCPPRSGCGADGVSCVRDTASCTLKHDILSHGPLAADVARHCPPFGFRFRWYGWCRSRRRLTLLHSPALSFCPLFFFAFKSRFTNSQFVAYFCSRMQEGFEVPEGEGELPVDEEETF